MKVTQSLILKSEIVIRSLNLRSRPSGLFGWINDTLDFIAFDCVESFFFSSQVSD